MFHRLREWHKLSPQRTQNLSKMSDKTGHFYSSEIYNNVESWQYFIIDKLPLSTNSSMTIT